MSRDQELTDRQWALLESLLPSCEGKRGRRFRDHRQVLEGIVFRYRTGCSWRDVPDRYGPWQTLWKRHARFSRDGTWDAMLSRLLAEADAAGRLDWAVSADSTSARVHQHGATARRHTGGPGELQESAVRT